MKCYCLEPITSGQKNTFGTEYYIHHRSLCDDWRLLLQRHIVYKKKIQIIIEGLWKDPIMLFYILT